MARRSSRSRRQGISRPSEQQRDSKGRLRAMLFYATERFPINHKQAYFQGLVSRILLMTTLRRLLLVAAFFLAAPLLAQEKSVRPGINKPFENPDLKDFLNKFEGESREIAAKAKEIVAACKLKPGMAVADIGAGTGLFSRQFAAEVGKKGRVYAVDIAPTFL